MLGNSGHHGKPRVILGGYACIYYAPQLLCSKVNSEIGTSSSQNKQKRRVYDTPTRKENFPCKTIHFKVAASYIPIDGNSLSPFKCPCAKYRASSSPHPVRDASALRRTNSSLIALQTPVITSPEIARTNRGIALSPGVGCDYLVART